MCREIKDRTKAAGPQQLVSLGLLISGYRLSRAPQTHGHFLSFPALLSNSLSLAQGYVSHLGTSVAF